eukprot:scaffold8152_cov102-Cylindrotheca_fusiformis.AAC.1
MPSQAHGPRAQKGPGGRVLHVLFIGSRWGVRSIFLALSMSFSHIAQGPTRTFALPYICLFKAIHPIGLCPSIKHSKA